MLVSSACRSDVQSSPARNTNQLKRSDDALPQVFPEKHNMLQKADHRCGYTAMLTLRRFEGPGGAEPSRGDTFNIASHFDILSSAYFGTHSCKDHPLDEHSTDRLGGKVMEGARAVSQETHRGLMTP